jgi:hypothetical protein
VFIRHGTVYDPMRKPEPKPFTEWWAEWDDEVLQLRKLSMTDE